VVLLGHSRGGNQTARFAASHPDPAISAVVLIAPQTWSAEGAAADYEKRYATKLNAVLEQAQGMVAEGKGGVFLDPVDLLYCEKTRATAASFVSYYEADEAMDTPRLIPAIQAPVLVFAGSDGNGLTGVCFFLGIMMITALVLRVRRSAPPAAIPSPYGPGNVQAPRGW